MDQIGSQDLKKVTFKSTVVALDDLGYQAGMAANKANLIKETNTSEAMRNAGEKAVKAYSGLGRRNRLSRRRLQGDQGFRRYASRNFRGEDKKLFDETLRDYRRAGLDFPPEKRKEVEELRKQLAKLGTDFDANIVNAKTPVVFTKAELDGLPDSFLLRRESRPATTPTR